MLAFKRNCRETKTENAVQQVFSFFARLPAAAHGIYNPPHTSLYDSDSKGIAGKQKEKTQCNKFSLFLHGCSRQRRGSTIPLIHHFITLIEKELLENKSENAVQQVFSFLHGCSRQRKGSTIPLFPLDDVNQGFAMFLFY